MSTTGNTEWQKYDDGDGDDVCCQQVTPAVQVIVFVASWHVDDDVMWCDVDNEVFTDETLRPVSDTQQNRAN